MKKFFFITLLFCFLFAVNCYGRIVEGIAAIVNDEIISISDLNNALIPIKEKIRMSGLSKEQKAKELEKAKKEILDNLILNKLIEQKAKELGYKVTEKDVDGVINNILREQHLTLEQLKNALKQSNISYEYYRNKLKGEVLRARVVNSYIRREIKIPKEDIEKYIKEHFLKNIKAEYHIQQILLKKYDKNKINKIMELLKKEPFSDVAKKFSEGPFKDKGGDLGFFKKGEMLPAIDKLVVNMTPGEIKTVKTKIGFHIIKLIEIKTKKLPEKEMYKRAENILKSKKFKEKLKEWLKTLRKKAVIIKKI